MIMDFVSILRFIFVVIFMIGGLFFFLTSTIGLLRFPDFFSRLHATGKGDTLAVLFSLIGISIYEGLSFTGVKIVIIAVFMFFTQPTATHAISRAGIRFGLQPWKKKEGTK